MDEKLLKHMAVNSFVLMLTVILISIMISQYGQTLIYADGSGLGDILSDPAKEGELSNLKQGKSEEGGNTPSYNASIKKSGDKYIIIKKSGNSYYNIDLEDLYMDRSVRLTITGLAGQIFDGTSIMRVNQGIEFNGIPAEPEEAAEPLVTSETQLTDKGANSHNTNINRNPEAEKFLIPELISATGEISDYGTSFQQISDPVKNFSITYKQEEDTNLYTAAINLALDFIYAPILYQDEEYIYIELRSPKDVYNKIVVIDAGHGGKDCGAFSQDEQYYEKDINLSIVLYLKEILEQEDFKVYYTRITDKTLFLNSRVNFANDTEADLFLSINCNSSESAGPGGLEVLYNEMQEGEGFQSRRLAEIALEEITKLTHRVNRGLVPGSEMVVVGKSKVPMALIEAAFMSNQEDLDFLLKEENKKNIAEAVHKIILRAFDELEE